MNNITMVGLLSLCLLGCGCLSTTGPVYEEAALEAKARDIHARILSLDTHCDTPGNMLDPAWDIGTRHEPGLDNSGQIDLPRMKEGGLDALFFGVFTGQGPLTPEGYASARSRAAAQIDAVEAMTAKHHALVEKATTPADAARLKKANGRRLSAWKTAIRSGKTFHLSRCTPAAASGTSPSATPPTTRSATAAWSGRIRRTGAFRNSGRRSWPNATGWAS